MVNNNDQLIDCPPLFFAIVTNDVLIRVSNPQFLFGVDLSTSSYVSFKDFKDVFSLLRCEVDQQSQCRVFQRQRNRFVPPLRRERRQRRFSFERIALFSLLQCSRVLRSSFRFFEETMVTIRISRAPRSHSTSTIPTL